jgi:hypothetical protein
MSESDGKMVNAEKNVTSMTNTGHPLSGPDELMVQHGDVLINDDDLHDFAGRITFLKSNSTDISRECSFSSIDYDWAFEWNIADCNAKVERQLIHEGGSKPVTHEENDVCFKKWNHPGTVQWRKVVHSFASNKEEFPEWCDDIYRLVRIKLQDHRFLLCRTNDGSPSKNVNNCWYLATAKEIFDRTKQRFLDDRKPPKEKTKMTANHLEVGR